MKTPLERTQEFFDLITTSDRLEYRFLTGQDIFVKRHFAASTVADELTNEELDQVVQAGISGINYQEINSNVADILRKAVKDLAVAALRCQIEVRERAENPS